jgi:hypothetical protein
MERASKVTHVHEQEGIIHCDSVLSPGKPHVRENTMTAPLCGQHMDSILIKFTKIKLGNALILLLPRLKEYLPAESFTFPILYHHNASSIKIP